MGRKLSMSNSQRTELDNRISAAWSTFHANKGELCSKHYPLRDRAKLFEACVTSVALYGCEAWALTKAMSAELDTVRHRMLRYVFRLHRRRGGSESESWVDYMIRSGQQARSLASSQSMEPWSTVYRRRKWRFAGQLSRFTDGRWSQAVLQWRPNACLGRSQGRPKTRWDDDISAFSGGDWVELARDENLWSVAESGFVSDI